MSLRMIAMLLATAGAIEMLVACAHGSARVEGTAVPADQARGAAIFAQQCEVCHGSAGAGGAIGPSLRGEHTRRSLRAVTEIIKNPAPPMPELYPGRLSARDVQNVAAYVESL